MPNSCVRSFTVMSMMLDTPTTPDSRVKSPIIHSAVRMMSVPWFICMFCVNLFHSQTASSSSGAARWLRFIPARYALSNFSFSSIVLRPVKVKNILSALSPRL